MATLVALLMIPVHGSESALHISRGTVKIITTSISPDYNLPWKMKDPVTSVGSGAIIKGGMILTNAHVVSDATYIQVRKESDPETYDAEIKFIGHDCDLAIISAIDPGFYRDTVELEFGDIPALRSKVTTYGYPRGGTRISITEGVTSRIDIGEYAHMGNVSFLFIQTDAAINPGNSGGPVMQDGRIVGVAFQASAKSENIGYMIPVPIIRHFLEDVTDGSYDGFPTLGAVTDTLENISYRRFLGMKDDQGGVLVSLIIPGGGAEKALRKGDVIMSIDSVPIANDGTIGFLDGRIYYSHLVDIKQIGDSITLKVLRGGKVLSAKYKLAEHPYRISWFNEYEKLPRYCIYGGMIFQPLSKEYLKTWNKWWYTADRRLLYYYSYYLSDVIHPEREEFVVMNKVIPDEANTYLADIRDRVVDSINHLPIRSLKDVVKAFGRPIDGFHVIRIDGTRFPLVLRASEMKAADQRIQKTYGIPSMIRVD